MVLPLLVLVTCGLAWLLTVGTAQVRLVDAAREVARALARGDERPLAIEAGQRVAPDGATFTVSEESGLVVVRVSAPAGDAGPVGAFLPDLTLRADAVALAEVRQ